MIFMSNNFDYGNFIINICRYSALVSLILVLFFIIFIALPIYIGTKNGYKQKYVTHSFKKLLESHTANNSKLINHLDKFPAIYFSFIVYVFILLLYIIIFTTNNKLNNQTVEAVNNMSNVVYTIILGTIGIVGICSSLKKSYYVVFNYSDVTQKYKFTPVCVNLIIVLFLSLINQTILYTYPNIACYFFIYPSITAAVILSGYLLLVTLILLFSNAKSELTLLDSLRYIYNNYENLSIETDNTIGTITNIQYLSNKYIKRLNKLNKKCNYKLENSFSYKFTRTKRNINKLNKLYNFIKTTSPIMIIGALTGAMFSVLINTNNHIITNGSMSMLIGYFLSLIFIYLFASIFLFILFKIKLLDGAIFHNIIYNAIYGNKAHFIFYSNNEMYHFSDFAVPFFFNQLGVKWLHSLKNLDVFFKIYTNTSDKKLQIDRMKKVINTYKENTSIFFKNKEVNSFIALPIILFLYHSFLNFEDKQSVIEFFKIQNITWDKELQYLSKSIIKDFYKGHTKFNQFLRAMSVK